MSYRQTRVACTLCPLCTKTASKISASTKLNFSLSCFSFNFAAKSIGLRLDDVAGVDFVALPLPLALVFDLPFVVGVVVRGADGTYLISGLLAPLLLQVGLSIWFTGVGCFCTSFSF